MQRFKTVLGDISERDLGVTLAHEHICYSTQQHNGEIADTLAEITALTRGDLMPLPLTEEQRNAVRTADVINLGSGPSAYAFDYMCSGVRGFNFGMTPSTFAMEQILIERLAPDLPNGCAVILTVCPFSFGKNNNDGNFRLRFSRYYQMLESTEAKKEIWFPYGVSREKKGCDKATLEIRTTSMLQIWEKEFDLSLTQNLPVDFDMIYRRNAEAFSVKRERLLQLYKTCENLGLRPHILLPPMAQTLRRRLPDGLLQIFLYENLQKLSGLRVLDCMDLMPDADFCGPVFLGLCGAVRFTQSIAAEVLKEH